MTPETPSTPKLAFVDVESTGLDPRVHQPWEIAAIIREPGMPDVEHVWQLRPGPGGADPESLRIGRFLERFAVPNGWDAVEVFPDGGRFRLTIHEALFDIQDALRDAHLVGANPAFDAGMLTTLLQSHERRIVWHYRLICVEVLGAGYLGQPVPQSLRKTANALDIPVDDAARHTALGDARLARDIYNTVQDLVRKDATYRNLLQAVFEAINISFPATEGHGKVCDRILRERVLHARAAMEHALGDARSATAEDLAWDVTYLREQLAKHPATGYVTHDQAHAALRQGATWDEAISANSSNNPDKPEGGASMGDPTQRTGDNVAQKVLENVDKYLDENDYVD